MKKLIKQICSELEMAEEYIHCSLNSNGENEKDLYKSLAKEELSHVEKLVSHGNAKVGSSSDEKCKIIWEYELEKIHYHLSRLKTELALI